MSVAIPAPGDARCDAIIVNYNAGPALAATVASLLRSAVVGTVWVVDNGSTDASLAALSALARVVVLPQHRNLGFARGCNVALPRARGDWVLYLNPDCRLETGALETMFATADADTRIGMIGPRILNTDGSEQAGARRALPTPWRAFVKAFGLTRLGARFPRLAPGLLADFSQNRQALPDHAVDVDAISGACMLVRRAALDAVGPLDEGYFMHCEDLDWCERFRRAGWRVVFEPTATVVHDKGVSSRARPLFVEWHKHRGMIRYYRKFFRERYPAPLMALVVTGVWLRFAAVAAAGLLRRGPARRGPARQREPGARDE